MAFTFVSRWFQQHEAQFSIPLAPSVLPSFAEVTNWVSGRPYTSDAKNQFFQAADYYLVAQALADSHTVVTHEVPSGATKKVKIPDVCVGLGIHCVSSEGRIDPP